MVVIVVFKMVVFLVVLKMFVNLVVVVIVVVLDIVVINEIYVILDIVVIDVAVVHWELYKQHWNLFYTDADAGKLREALKLLENEIKNLKQDRNTKVLLLFKVTFNVFVSRGLCKTDMETPEMSHVNGAKAGKSKNIT